MLPSIFDRGKLRTSGLCYSLLHLTVYTEMTGNTIERLMKFLYERLELGLVYTISDHFSCRIVFMNPIQKMFRSMAVYIPNSGAECRWCTLPGSSLPRNAWYAGAARMGHIFELRYRDGFRFLPSGIKIGTDFQTPV